jgi:hypothetical protein
LQLFVISDAFVGMEPIDRDTKIVNVVSDHLADLPEFELITLT